MGVSETTTRIIIPQQPHCVLSLITLSTLSYFRCDSSYILQPSDAHIFLSPFFFYNWPITAYAVSSVCRSDALYYSREILRQSMWGEF